MKDLLKHKQYLIMALRYASKTGDAMRINALSSELLILLDQEYKMKTINNNKI